MNILFWNIRRDRKGDDGGLLLSALCNIIDEESIDVVALAEYNMYIEQLISRLVAEKGFTHLAKRSEKDDKVVVFYRKDKVRVAIREEMEYTTALQFQSVGSEISINGFICHLKSKLHSSERAQDLIAQHYMEEVVDYEIRTRNNKTFICGDFNMSPFEMNMISANCFHAIMDAKWVSRNPSREVDKRKYFTFYNPMWGLAGDVGKGEVPGSYFYHKSNPDEYFWHIFDQVIIRPSLIEYFDSSKLKILSEGENYNLMTKNNIISGKYSDHLPICFTLNF